MNKYTILGLILASIALILQTFFDKKKYKKISRILLFFGLGAIWFQAVGTFNARNKVKEDIILDAKQNKDEINSNIENIKNDLVNDRIPKFIVKPEFVWNKSDGTKRARNLIVRNYGDIGAEIKFVDFYFKKAPIYLKSEWCTKVYTEKTFWNIRYNCKNRSNDENYFKVIPNTAIRIPVEFLVNENLKYIKCNIGYMSKNIDEVKEIDIYLE